MSRSESAGKHTRPGGRQRVAADEESAFSVQPNIARLRWNNVHRNTNCRRLCRDHSEHFQVWRDAYEPYLEQLYTVFSRALKPSKVSFSDFSEFAYSNSSGYISRHA